MNELMIPVTQTPGEESDHMDIKKLRIDEIGLSVRSSNGLSYAGIHTVEELLNLTEEELFSIRHLGSKSVAEILEKQRFYASGGTIEELNDVHNEFSEVSTESLKKMRIQDTKMSARVINALFRAGIQTVEEMLLLSEDQLLKIPSLVDRKDIA